MTPHPNPYDPLEYARTLKIGDHATQLYGDRNFARQVQFEFIKQGLTNGEVSVFASLEDREAVLQEMRNCGIDVEAEQEKELLYVFQIPDIFNDPRGISTAYNEFYEKFLSGLKTPMRFTDDLLYTSENLDWAKYQEMISLEHWFENWYDKSKFCVLCTHPTEFVSGENREKWLREISKNHGYSFYTSKNTGFVVDNRFKKDDF